jgi:ATP-binding cassette subfamily C protein LapB
MKAPVAEQAVEDGVIAACDDAVAAGGPPLEGPVPESTLPPAQGLTDCLLAVARYLGKPSTMQALQAGVPLVEGEIEDRHVAEAIGRIGLVADALVVPVADITRSQLPAVLRGADQRALALLRIDGDGFVVADGAGEARWLPRAQVTQASGSSVWFVRPALLLDQRSMLIDTRPRREWFWAPFRENKQIYLRAAMGGFFINVAALAVSLFIQAVYDRVVPNHAYESLIALTIGVGIVAIVQQMLSTLRAYLVDAAGRRFDVQVGSRVFAHMLSMRTRDRPQSAGALANILREFETIRDFFSSLTLIGIGDAPFVFIFLFVMWLIGGWLVLVPLIAIPIMVAVGLWLQRPLSKLIAQLFREGTQKSAFLYEMAGAVDTVRAINAQAWARRQWERLVVQNSETTLRARHLSHMTVNLVGLINNLTTIAVVALGAVLIIMGHITSGALVACTILVGRVMAPFAMVAGMVTRWQQTRVAMEALDKLMAAEPEDDPAKQLLHLPNAAGRLTYQGIKFAYPAPGPQAPQRPPVLRELDLEIAAGESVAVLGRIGCGKSTLFKLALNLVEPDEGWAALDGIDVRQIHPADLRRLIGYVGQDTVLFHGTIKENIALGRPNATDEAIIGAAKLAGLGELLAASPYGLATPVGERGELLSGGQRQAVTLARALIADPPVLLMDEPTSHMDQTTEQQLISHLREARAGKTTVVITHRPAILALATRTVVIDGGKVALSGPTDTVLQRLARPAEAVPARVAPVRAVGG